MNSNFRNYNGYIIKRTTIHTVNGACLPNYEIYNEEDVCFKNRLMCEEKLKDAKKWIDEQINWFMVRLEGWLWEKLWNRGLKQREED